MTRTGRPDAASDVASAASPQVSFARTTILLEKIRAERGGHGEPLQGVRQAGVQRGCDRPSAEVFVLESTIRKDPADEGRGISIEATTDRPKRRDYGSPDLVFRPRRGGDVEDGDTVSLDRGQFGGTCLQVSVPREECVTVGAGPPEDDFVGRAGRKARMLPGIDDIDAFGSKGVPQRTAATLVKEDPKRRGPGSRVRPTPRRRRPPSPAPP